MKRINRITKGLVLLLLFAALVSGCRKQVAVPKPRGFFRIDLPDKKYIPFSNQGQKANELPLSFEYPAYGKISYESEDVTSPGWVNIDFPIFKARLYLTYKQINNNLESLLDQAYKLNVKNHIIKADAISESVIINPEKKVYGILYNLKGNTATSVQFFVTDSVRNYLRGSLYFSAEPNPDSLAPVLDFIRKDIDHLLETLQWEKTI